MRQERIGIKIRTATAVALSITVMLALTGCAHAPGPRTVGSEVGPGDVPDVLQPPPNAKTLYAMARVLLAQQKEEQAEWVLRRTIAQFEDYTPAYAELAKILMNRGRLDAAKECLDQGLAAVPDDAILINNLGVCALVDNDLEAALGYFDRALEIAPHHGAFRANRALVLGLQGNDEEATRIYRIFLPETSVQRNLEVIRQVRDGRSDWNPAGSAALLDPEQSWAEPSTAVAAVEEVMAVPVE